MPHSYLWLAAFLAAPLSHAHAEDVILATVTKAPDPKAERPSIMVDDGECERYVSLVDSTVVWHLEPTVLLPLTSLRAGTRVRVIGDYWSAKRIEIVTLGRYEMSAVVEEWVVEATGGERSKVLTTSQIATLDAMASPAWLVRDATSKALQDRGMGALPLLIWGRHASDPEVRLRCEGLLRRLGWGR